MIGSYLTDIVDLVRVTVDQWGDPTEATTTGVKARVEDKISVIRDKDGKEFTSEVHLFLRASVAVDYQTFIKVKSRCGVAAGLPLKKWPVKKLAKSHAFGVLCWEVWL